MSEHGAAGARPVADLAVGLDERPAWQSQGNCLGVDPELFFPVNVGGLREAQAVCAGCSVRLECLEHALTHHEHHGVWGGLSERARRRIKRGRRQGA